MRGTVPVMIIAAVVALALLGLFLVMAGVAKAQDTESAGTTSAVIQPRPSCVAYITRRGQVKGSCYVFRREQVRLRADCIAFPDTYSKWKGHKSYRRSFSTRICPFGTRGPIWEVRGA